MIKLLAKSANPNIFKIKRLFYFNLAFFFLTGLFTSCSSPVDLPGFDKKAWQKDVRCCDNIRPQLALTLMKNKCQLLGLTHNDILDLLGKPEGNSLEKSGERVYYYFVQPGSQCNNKNLLSEANKLFIRFDALDRVYKIRIENKI